jgi:photosynthetic reaction center PufX protein
MSDKPYFHEPNHTIHLRVWALGQMIWGAFLAGVFVVAIGAVLAAIYIVGLLLPEESKQAPSPFGAVIVQSDEDVA